MLKKATEVAAKAIGDDLTSEAVVRAVLEAIREPDEAMKSAGYTEVDFAFECQERVNPTEIWQAMIDALLAEKP